MNPFFCLKAGVAMHYCDRRGYAGCTLCLLCIVLLWPEMMACTGQHTDTRKGFSSNNRFCLAAVSGDITCFFFFFLKGASRGPVAWCSKRKQAAVRPTPPSLAFPTQM